MRHLVLTLIMSSLLSAGVIAQSDNMVYRYYFKFDSTYVIVDDSKDNWFTIEIKADTLFLNEDNRIVFDYKNSYKLM